MIWHICFISLNNLFEIQLFSSQWNHPLSYRHTYLSWTDHTHSRLSTATNLSSVALIGRCYRPLEYKIAKCPLIRRCYDELYECHRNRRFHLQKRLKRDRTNDDELKRSPYAFLSLVIGIPFCLLGIIIGIAITMFISIKRQQRLEQQNTISNQIDLETPLGSINTSIPKRLNYDRNFARSPALNSLSDQVSIQRERETPESTTMILNRYKPERKLIMPRTPATNYGYMNKTLSYEHMSNTMKNARVPLSPQSYARSRNAKYSMRTNFLQNVRSRSH